MIPDPGPEPEPGFGFVVLVGERRCVAERALASCATRHVEQAAELSQKAT